MKLKLITCLIMVLFVLNIFTASSDSIEDSTEKVSRKKLQLLTAGLKKLLDQVGKDDETYSSSEDEESYSSSDEDYENRDELLVAIKNKDLKAVKRALKLYCGIDHRFDSGSTLLHIACKYNIDISIVDFLIKKGIDINAVDARGWTALFYAIRKNSKEVVKLLLENGALVNINDDTGIRPITIAVGKGNKTIFEMLIKQYGADFKDVVNSEKENLLFYAVQGPENAFIIKFLIENGVDPEVINIYNSTSFHAAITTGHPKNIETLMNLSSKISDNINSVGHSPLSLAVINGKFKIAELLIKRGSNVYWRQSQARYLFCKLDEIEYNLLHFACAQLGSETIIELLLQGGIDINSRSRSGLTPLMVAFKSGNEEIIHFLLHLGATMSIVDNEYKTCLHHLILSNKFIRLDQQWIKALINNKDIEGNTPLHLAVQYSDCFNNASYIKLFIDNGADLNIVNDKKFKAVDLAPNDTIRALFKK